MLYSHIQAASRRRQLAMQRRPRRRAQQADRMWPDSPRHRGVEKHILGFGRFLAASRESRVADTDPVLLDGSGRDNGQSRVFYFAFFILLLDGLGRVAFFGGDLLPPTWAVGQVSQVASHPAQREDPDA